MYRLLRSDDRTQTLSPKISTARPNILQQGGAACYHGFWARLRLRRAAILSKLDVRDG